MQKTDFRQFLIPFSKWGRVQFLITISWDYMDIPHERYLGEIFFRS